MPTTAPFESDGFTPAPIVTTGQLALVRSSIIAGQPVHESIVEVVAIDGDTLTYKNGEFWESTATVSNVQTWALIEPTPAKTGRHAKTVYNLDAPVIALVRCDATDVPHPLKPNCTNPHTAGYSDDGTLDPGVSVECAWWATCPNMATTVLGGAPICASCATIAAL
jgi:hypothetical protein